MERWRGHVLSARLDPDNRLKVLFDLWEELSTQLTGALRAARLTGLVPDHGGVLAFVGGLSKCVVIRYQMFAGTPRLNVVAVINEPKSAFDFWGVLDDVDARARNYLKAILATGHKLVYHRGTLIHVDRRVDMGVFGPSIDTLVMAELLGQELLERADGHVKSALEVGCGNGLVTVSLHQHLKSLVDLVALDVDFEAVACTRRNWRATAERSLGREDARTYFVTGPFRADLLQEKFDLVVCNPPYIPLPPEYRGDGPVAEFFRAVGGTELLKEVVGAAPDLLTDSGQMLLMVSELSLREAEEALPKGHRMRRPLGDNGVDVLFDVEAVLGRPEWVEFLVRERGLVERGGFFFHRLHPMWISLDR